MSSKSAGFADRFNRIFSILGVAVGLGIIVWLLFHVRDTVDFSTLRATLRPGWIGLAFLSIPALEFVDSLIFYHMGKKSGQPVSLSRCFDCTFIGELYYRLGFVGAPVQLKLMLDAGFTHTGTATVYTWKAIANTIVYGLYAVTALSYKLIFKHKDLGWAVIPTAALIAGYVLLCGSVFYVAARPEQAGRLIGRMVDFGARHLSVLRKHDRANRLKVKGMEFCTQIQSFRNNAALLSGMFIGMFFELTLLFMTPYLLFRGLGLTGISFAELLLSQCLVMVLSRVVALPGNAGGAEGSFYLFMSPYFGGLLTVAMVLWRLITFVWVMLIGGVYSVVRFALRAVRH